MIQEIINNYKRFINARGWTHADAAKAVGCCRAHMTRILNKSVKTMIIDVKVVTGVSPLTISGNIGIY